MVKKVVVSLFILSVAIFALICYGLHLMGVEYRYGDLQQLYYKSKDGDIILNNLNSKIGIVELDKSRIYVREGKRWIDIEEWLDPKDKRIFKATIYRPKHPITTIEKFNEQELNSKCKLITEATIQY